MENVEKKLETVQETIDVLNQSPTDADTVGRLVDEFSLSRLLNNRQETNEVDEHHHESLDVEGLENSLSQKLQLNNSNEVDLNEDCLLEIFSYLSIEDMTQVEKVCEKWHQVSQRQFEKIQTLVYHEERNGSGRVELYEKYYNRKIYEKTTIHGFNDFISILSSYGQYIKYYKAEIFLNEIYPPTEECKKFIFNWVPKFCKNITDVQIFGGKNIFTPSTFKIMAKHWKKLEKIDIKYLPKSIEEYFFELLRNNKQLKTLRLFFEYSYGGRKNDEFFTYLPKTIEEIRITVSNDESEQLNNFISASKNFTSLQLLKLSGFYHLTDGVVAAIADIQSLTRLSLSDVRSYESLGPIANLKGLKSLHLSRHRYKDSVINLVERCTQLELLSIIDENMLTHEVLAAIAKLQNLKCLNIHMGNIDMEDMTAESISNLFDSLKVFYCFHSKMNDNDAVMLLDKGTNLRLVKFHFCENLTKDFLHTANKIANERRNNILYITTYCCYNVNAQDIDTPYFKYFKRAKKIPLEIFSNNIRNYIKGGLIF